MLHRGREAAGRQLAGHRADALALALVVVGVLVGLGLWTDLAGPVGSAVADGTGAVLGRARVALPVGCIAFAVVLLWPRRATQIDLETGEITTVPAGSAFSAESADSPERPTLRIAIGAALLIVADVAILHLAYGRPSIDGPVADLRGAGGFFGAAIGGPLASATGVAGASVILGAVAFLGLLLALGLSIGTVAAFAGRGLRRGVGGAAGKARDYMGVDTIGRDPDADPNADPSIAGSPFDQDATFADTVYADTAYAEPAELAEPAADEPVDALVVEPEPTVAPAAAEILTREGDDGQLAIVLGDDVAAHQGPWKLPPMNILKRGSGKEADRRLVEEGGRVLEATLAHHGVEAHLVGTTVGPTVTATSSSSAPV